MPFAWLKSLRNTWPWLQNPYGFLSKSAAQEKSFNFIRHIPIMGRTLFTGDPQFIKEIVHHPDLSSGKGIVSLRSVLGNNSLIMLDDEEHAKRKRVLYPSFHGSQLKLRDRSYFQVARTLASKWHKQDVFPIYNLIHRIALRSIAEIMFGPSNPHLLNQAEKAIHDFLFSFSNPMLLFLKPLQRDLGPWSPWGKAIRKRTILRELCQHQIERSRLNPELQGVIAEITQRSAEITDEVLITEILTLLMFGHDTAAITMTWATALIHKNKHICQRVRDEIDSVDLQQDINPSNFPYLQACIDESMRIRPVVVHLTRVVERHITIGDFTMQSGDRVAPSPYLTHHNPQLWPDPHIFDPQRFIERKPSPFSYLPFGIGRRTCIGRALVQRQMPMILAGMLKGIRVQLAPNYTIKPARQMVLMAPQKGCLVTSVGVHTS